MARRSDIDWQGIEKAWRLNQLTDSEIGRQFGVHHASIARKAEKEGWTRDVTEEIQQRTRAALAKPETPAIPPNAQNAQTECAAHYAPSEADIQLAVATNVAVVRSHQKTLRRAHDLGSRLLARAEEIVAAIEQMPVGPKRDDKMQAAAIAERGADLVGKALAIVTKAIPLERQAFNIEDGAQRLEVTGKNGEPVQVEHSGGVSGLLAAARQARADRQGSE